MSYIFLKATNSDESKYYVIPASKIKTLNLHAAYDEHGQLVGHENAGDYHFDNCYSDAIIECNKALVASGLLNNKDDITWVMDGDVARVEDLYGENDACNAEAIEEFARKWRSENESLIKAQGFDYWDGHNWQTITVAVDFGEPTHRKVEDEQLIASLQEVIDTMELKKEGNGLKIFESGEYVAIFSQFASAWEEYTIMPASEYAL